MMKQVLERLYLCQGVDILPSGESFMLFEPGTSIQYHPFCDDFGPLNVSSVISFVEQLQSELADNTSRILLYSVGSSQRELTNAIFFIGAFMVLIQGRASQEVVESFAWAKPYTEAYRDATYAAPSFELSLADCWAALTKGIGKGWVGMPSFQEYLYGEIDIDEYDHYDCPLNGDMHEVVPGKFIAFKGPRDLGGVDFHDDEGGFRDFSPEFFAAVFGDFGVTAVVRLNEAHYEGRRFEDRGMGFHDLAFEDCTAPPPAVVEAFMRLADAAAGPVAVHCRAGLGRTGTLIGVYLMRREGFTAREAMGWLRMMRPGSVIGEQQQFLCALEAAGAAAEHGAVAAQADEEPGRALRGAFASGDGPGDASGVGVDAANNGPGVSDDDGQGVSLQMTATDADGRGARAPRSAALLAEQVAAGAARRAGARKRPGRAGLAAVREEEAVEEGPQTDQGPGLG